MTRIPCLLLIRPSFIIIIIVVLLSAITACADEPALKTRLEAKLQKMECPGALVGIFGPNGQVEQYALGVADVNTREPMQLNFHMRIGSVTKLFVGTLVLQLADEGKLSLNDPVSQYIANVPNGDQITLRQLGNHTSGLYNSIQDRKFQYAIMDSPEKDWRTKEILDVAFSHASYFSPGTSFHYSNTNTILLGLVVENVTGQSWPEVIADRIAKPLELKHTGVPQQRGVLPDPHPSGYRNGDGKRIIGYGDTFYDVSNYSASNTGAAGNLYSTLDDLGRAIRPLATGQLLKEDGRKELHRWVDSGGEGSQYGFCIGKLKAGIGHQGDVPGFNATAVYLPERNCSVVALTNLSNNKDRTMPADELVKVVLSQWKESRAQAE